jgi:5-methylcytosine-specific restriction enzyme subunit McrC
MKTLRRIKPEVSFIQLRREHFRKVTFSRENEHYRPVINLCKLIFDRKALDKSGEIFGFGLPDNKKARIFETFLHNYLHDEFEKAPITVKPEKKKGWIERESDRDYIPGIQPDIVVREEDTPVMVLDAKFYKKAVKSGQYEGKDNQKTHSKNLYQILSYINYYNCDGMLVYAQTERGHFEQMAKINDEHYADQGPDREFGFYTLDLSGGLDQLRKSMEQLRAEVSKRFMAESKV